jgi:hypothetical protein
MPSHLRRAIPDASILVPVLPDDALINQSAAKLLAGDVSDMTFWRWRKNGVIPEPLKIRGRNYWQKGEFLQALETAAQESTQVTGAV